MIPFWWWLVAGVALGGVLAIIPVRYATAVVIVAFTAAFAPLILARGSEFLAPLLVLALALPLALPPRLRLLTWRPTLAGRRRASEPPPAEEPTEEIPPGPLVIPGFEVLEKVGSGGMATVYRARRVAGGQVVALKVLLTHLAEDENFIRRFHREAELARRLDHPNIVRTFEHGNVRGVHFMVMDFVDGSPLERFVEAGDLDVGITMAVIGRVAEALMHVHALGIVHRDVKPANVMIEHGGIERRPSGAHLHPDAVRLMDFGIAGGRVLTRLTVTGARVGTPTYMSPEQARGQRIDHRSDIYSLGLLAYEMLTFRSAFKGGHEAVLHQQMFDLPPPPRQVDIEIPKALDALVMRMIAKEPDERPSLAEIVAALADIDPAADTDEPLEATLLLAVESNEAVVRALDLNGSLEASFGDVGPDDHDFAAVPLALAASPGSGLITAEIDHDGAIALFHRAGRGHRERLMDAGEHWSRPRALARDAEGVVTLLDGPTASIVRLHSDGSLLARIGGPGEGEGRFVDPQAFAVGSDGRLFVLDVGQRQVQRFARDGTYETRWAFRAPGGDDAGFRELDGVHVDASGRLYVGEVDGGRIRTIEPDGQLGPTFDLDDSEDTPLGTPLELTTDSRDRIYAAHRGSRRIQRFDARGRHLAPLDAYAPVVGMALARR